jgi:uncharacterized membrane protein
MKLEEKFPREYLQVLAHFYRGEVNRSTIWRQRMDATTSWAILATTATFSWAFTSEKVEAQFIFPFATLLVILLLFVEARRYRYYDVWRTRVRMLEVHLMVPALNPHLDILEGDWRTVLSNDLLLPTFKISALEAIGRRLYRNYFWLFVILFLGWSLRIYSLADQLGDNNGWVDLREFYEACRYKFIPPAVTLILEGVPNLLILVVLAVTWRRRAITGEIRRKDPQARKWPI